MKKQYFILFILCLNLSLFAKKGSEKKANSLFAKRSYVKAAEMYEQLGENRNVLQNLVDCYYNNSQMKEAVRAYGKLFVTYKKDTLDSEDYFGYEHWFLGMAYYEKYYKSMGVLLK